MENGKFRDHGKINGDPVSFFYAFFPEYIGKAIYLIVKLLIGEVLYTPPSASQMIAALFRVGVLMNRSRQFTDAFSFPR